MAASLSARLKARNAWAAKTPFSYGWVVVAIGALAMFATTPGQSDSFAMFMDSFVDEFGWSRTYLSSLYAAATLLAGGLMLFVGRIVDRVGAKWVAIAAAAILGIACVLLSAVISPVMLFGGFFLARFAGKGALDLSASTLAPSWFIKRRALTIMLVSLGGTAGAVIFPLLNNYLITTFGWRQAYQFLAAGLWLIFIPIAFFFLISRPEDVGLQPDANATPNVNTTPADEITTATIDEVSFTQGQAMRTSAFWIIAFCVFQASLVGTGVILHFISIFDERGFDMAYAAKMMSIKPLIAFVTVVVAGLSLDRIKHQNYVLALACLGQVAGYVLLAFLNSPTMALALRGHHRHLSLAVRPEHRRAQAQSLWPALPGRHPRRDGGHQRRRIGDWPDSLWRGLRHCRRISRSHPVLGAAAVGGRRAQPDVAQAAVG